MEKRFSPHSTEIQRLRQKHFQKAIIQARALPPLIMNSIRSIHSSHALLPLSSSSIFSFFSITSVNITAQQIKFPTLATTIRKINEKLILMLNRQDTLLSSSSRRETQPPPPPDKYQRAKSIGCMSAVFHFLSRYQHRRKFLTFGKKHEKVQQPKSSSVAYRDGLRRFSWDAPRSPAIPKEIRRSKSMNFKQHGHSSPPALVAGLQEKVPTGHFQEMEYDNYSTSDTLEKRRKLMSDLEKCDEDLKELKKIIETIRFAEHLRSPPALKRPNTFGSGRENTVKKREYYGNCEQPSLVSVLDESTRSPLISSTYSSRRHITNGQMTIPTPMPQQQKPTARKKPGEDDAFDSAFFNKLAAESLQAKREATGSSPIWGSKAMVESVDEVCEDIAWGEKREIGRIGLAIQDFICRDLIEEVVKDYSGCCCNSTTYPLPLQACKRTLRF